MAAPSLMLSVVAPIYFEEKVIREFYARTKAVLLSLGPELDHELIFVNDGSTDGSGAILQELSATDPAVRVLEFSRNFGHQIAITAGIDHARGEAVVVIDSDLQDPPEVIARMIEKWRAGFKVVYGVRRRRAGENWFKLLTAAVFYRVLGTLSETPLIMDSGDFRLMDRDVVRVINEIREENRYLRGLVSWAGFSQCGVTYDRDRRFAGETKFSLLRMMRFALDGISSFSDRPLRLASQLGFLVTVAAFLLALWIAIGKIFRPDTVVQGWTTLMVIMLFLGGIQLLSVGILGEYVGRIFRQTKQRPLYIVSRRINVEPTHAGRVVEV